MTLAAVVNSHGAHTTCTVLTRIPWLSRHSSEAGTSIAITGQVGKLRLGLCDSSVLTQLLPAEAGHCPGHLTLQPLAMGP